MSPHQPYIYHVHGLTLASDIRLPELLPGTGPPDVTIQYGHVPTSLANPTVHSAFAHIQSTSWLLLVERIAGARFLVREGKEIVVERVSEGSPETLRLFILGSCMGAVLFQRGMLPLHGNAIATAKGALVLCGESGAGKSTLAAVLHLRGYQVLADDICAVHLNPNGAPIVAPGYPRLKLWVDTLSQLGASLDGLQRIRPELDKYHMPAHDAFCDHPQPLAAVYILAVSNAKRPSISPLSGMTKLQTLKDHLYKMRLPEAHGLWPGVFSSLTTVARRARVRALTRPDGVFLLDELADLVETDYLT